MIEQATVHPPHADTDTNLPVSIYLVPLSRRIPHMDYLCMPGDYFWAQTLQNSVHAKFPVSRQGEVRRTSLLSS
jgi:hypothetical protein